MNIRLKPDTEEWLQAQVAEGRFESIEQAVEIYLDESRRDQEELDTADLSWAQPYIEEGLADLEAGRVHPAEEVFAEIRAMFARPPRPGPIGLS
jgi:predicted transcriptional regulator